jgi:hypothetical protein
MTNGVRCAGVLDKEGVRLAPLSFPWEAGVQGCGLWPLASARRAATPYHLSMYERTT